MIGCKVVPRYREGSWEMKGDVQAENLRSLRGRYLTAAKSVERVGWLRQWIGYILWLIAMMREWVSLSETEDMTTSQVIQPSEERMEFLGVHARKRQATELEVYALVLLMLKTNYNVVSRLLWWLPRSLWRGGPISVNTITRPPVETSFGLTLACVCHWVARWSMICSDFKCAFDWSWV